jgi:hypothetical protein
MRFFPPAECRAATSNDGYCRTEGRGVDWPAVGQLNVGGSSQRSLVIDGDSDNVARFHVLRLCRSGVAAAKSLVGGKFGRFPGWDVTPNPALGCDFPIACSFQLDTTRRRSTGNRCGKFLVHGMATVEVKLAAFRESAAGTTCRLQLPYPDGEHPKRRFRQKDYRDHMRLPPPPDWE